MDTPSLLLFIAAGLMLNLTPGPGMSHKPLAFLWLGLLFNVNGSGVNLGWALATAWMARALVLFSAARSGWNALQGSCSSVLAFG